MAEPILDLRQLADEWEAELEEYAIGTPHPEISAPYAELCNQLGIATTPDALRDHDEPELISAASFTEYCRDLCTDVGHEALGKLPHYIRDNIDWSGVADALSVDYDEVEFGGRSYCIRSS